MRACMHASLQTVLFLAQSVPPHQRGAGLLAIIIHSTASLTPPPHQRGAGLLAIIR